jgi:Lipocalin-like domain
MNRRCILNTLVITATGLILIASQATAQTAKDLVGTWTAVSADAYGPTPKGSLNFDSNGRFTLILMRSDLPKYASNNRTQGTPAENRATVEGILAYFGTYSVSGTDLNLHIEGSTFPNWTGTDQKRTNLAVVGDELKYTQPTPSGGGSAAHLVWKRVK